MRNTELAYIAGILDGEGCISILRTRRRGMTVPTSALAVVIANSNITVLKWIRKLFGFGFGKIYAISTYTNKTLRRTHYNLRFSQKQSVTLLNWLLPYLRIKKANAILAIAFQSQKEQMLRKLTRRASYNDEAT
jgi:hypothetical protein